MFENLSTRIFPSNSFLYDSLSRKLEQSLKDILYLHNCKRVRFMNVEFHVYKLGEFASCEKGISERSKLRHIKFILFYL